jgi:hypothetical protein
VKLTPAAGPKVEKVAKDLDGMNNANDHLGLTRFFQSPHPDNKMQRKAKPTPSVESNNMLKMLEIKHHSV